MSSPSLVDAAGVVPLTPQLAEQIMAVRGAPLVSVLMTTASAPRMTAADAARLHDSCARAVERLDRLGTPAVGAAVADRLRHLAAAVERGPTTEAVALYAAAAWSRAVQLPLPVRDRVVVDPTFATRDLLRCLHRTPRHAVLVLTDDRAELLEGVDGRLRPVLGAGFPLPLGEGAAVHGDLRVVDRALGAHLADRPAPLVLAGPDDLVTEFWGVSRHLGRLAGTLPLAPGEHQRREAPGAGAGDELERRIRPVLDTYLHSRQDDALDLLERRAAADRVVSGVQAVWSAAHHEQPEMLAVEEGFSRPARLNAAGDLLAAVGGAHDPDAPDVVDDAVDELIEHVLARGGWIAFVDDGRLADHDRIAMTVRGGREGGAPARVDLTGRRGGEAVRQLARRR